MIPSINFYLCIFMEFVDNKKNSDFLKTAHLRSSPCQGVFYGSNKTVERIFLSAKSCKHPLTQVLFVYASRGRQKKAGRETTKDKER